jgi:flagellar assembly protein FliH
MIHRMDRFGMALRRWHFPELDPQEAAEAAMPLGEEAAPPAEPEVAGNGAAADPEQDREWRAAELRRGYAEGIERGLAEGRENGYAAGVAAGEEAARQSLAGEARRIAGVAERLAAPIAAVERIVEDALVGLALELARCVVGSEIARSPASLVHLIREALAQAPVRLSGLRIVLNAADLDLVRALAPDVESGGAALVGDPEMEPGGCLIAVEEGDGPVKDRRWRPRAGEASPHIDLSLAARWRTAMLALFDGEAA